jgi:hypothetical protein
MASQGQGRVAKSVYTNQHVVTGLFMSYDLRKIPDQTAVRFGD